VIYRLLDPGSECACTDSVASTALDELLGLPWEVLDKDCLYRCLDQLLQSSGALVQASARPLAETSSGEIRRAALRSETDLLRSDPPFPEGDKRRFGYSRDKRPDCVQVILALIVTPEGYPLALREVVAGQHQ